MERRALLILAALLACVLAGCGDTQTEVVNQPYQPTEPPADFMKKMEENRAKAGAPGAQGPTDAQKAPPSSGQ